MTDDRVGHRLGAHGGFPESDVARACATGDGGAHGGFDARGDGVEAKAEAKHQSDGEDLRTGIGDTLARDVGGGAAGGFVETEGEAEGVFSRAEGGGGEHSE